MTRYVSAQELGKYLASLRPGGRPSLRVVAERGGLSHEFLAKLELGRYKTVELETLRKVAKGYGAPVEELLRISGLTAGLPDLPLYLRTKYGLTDEGIKEAEAFIRQMRRKHGKRRG